MPRCSIGKVHTIIAGLEANWPIAAIAEQAAVSHMTVYRIRTSLDLWGEPYPPSVAVMGRPRSLLPVHEEVSLCEQSCGVAEVDLRP